LTDPSKQVQEFTIEDRSEHGEGSYEFVYARTIEHLFVQLYKLSLHIKFFVKDVVSMQDPRFSFKALGALSLIWFFSSFCSDATLLWIGKLSPDHCQFSTS